MVADVFGGGRSDALRRLAGERLLDWLKDPDAIPPANRAERRERARRHRKRVNALRRHIIEVVQKRVERAWRKQRRLARLTG